jgi:competence protein ComEC
MDFLQRTPFLRLLLPLILGIISYQFVALFDWSQVVLISLSVCFILSSFIIRKSKLQYQFRWLFGSGIFLFIVVLGYYVSEQYEKENSFQHLNKSGVYTVELTESPIEKANSYLCRVKTLQVFDSLQNATSKGKAIIYFQKDSAAALLQSGDRLLVETTFRKPEGDKNPNGFDYATYLKRQGIGSTVYLQGHSWRKIGENTSFSIFRLAEKSQQNLLRVYKRFGIEGDEYAVLAALTLGSKDALHPELRQNYTTSGGMHILAVSGLHVGIIYMVLSFLFSFLDRKSGLKIYKALIVVLLLWIYAFITGLPPSVIRATMMFSFVALGESMERKSQIYNTISVSAFLMLLYNPNFLFDVGFQLSFSAVLSIVYFQPQIKNWFIIKNKPLSWAWNLTAVSIAAQIGTAPFSIYYFHQFPNYFLLTNFIAIPLAMFIIYGAVLLFVFSPVPYISVAVAFVLHWLLRVLNFCIQFIHDLPFSTTITSINIWQVVSLFGIVLFMSFYFQTKKYIPFFGSLVLVFAIISINLYVNLNTLNVSRLIVFADKKNTHIDFVDGKKHYLFTTDSLSAERVAGNFWLQNKLDKPINLNGENFTTDGFVEFIDKKFLILTDNWLKDIMTSKPVTVDYLIIGNGMKPKINEILECVVPTNIIVDGSISGWYIENIRQNCVKRGIAFYSVSERGAYVLNFKH